MLKGSMGECGFSSRPFPNFMPAFEQKICTRSELQQRVASLPKPVVLTNGVFDILHRGHVTYLAQARELGASLVMAVLAALEAVSLVVEFDEDTALEAVQQARPDIYAKGGDYVMTEIPEGKAV